MSIPALASDRRKSVRGAPWVEAVCHAGGMTCRARISDVSNGGCRAEMAVKGVGPGDTVVLRLTDLMVLPATVVWVKDGQSGLRFASPMVGAMLRQFVLRFGERSRLH